MLTLTACNSGSSVPTAVTEHKPVPTETPAAPAPSAPEPLLPCPVKLIHSRMEHNLEMDVYTTIVNISKSDITAIAFNAWHTNRFGETLSPYKTVLSHEDTIRRGQSYSIHWEILMEEHVGNGKPGHSELSVDRVAFSDGRLLHGSDFDGCDFEL